MVATRKKAVSGASSEMVEKHSRSRPHGSGKHAPGKRRSVVTRKLKTPREIQQIDVNSGLVLTTFLSAKDAAAAVGGHYSNISRAAKSGKAAYGYHWKWIVVEKEEEHQQMKKKQGKGTKRKM